MIALKIQMDVCSGKRTELEQTLTSLVADMREESHCERANVHRDVQDENRYYVIAEWESREHLNAFLQSEQCGALLGTKILLRAAPVVSIDDVVQREGMETITAVRSGG